VQRVTRWALWVELAVLFVVLPMAHYLDAIPLPVIPLLLLGTAYCALVILRDPSFPKRNLWRRVRDSGKVRASLVLFGLSALGLGLCVWLFQPKWLFNLVRDKPQIWALVLVLYPILSVYPQELVYRAFIFHRYRGLVPTEWGIVALSAITFSFMHVVYDNWIALLLTLIGGIVFARTYQKTRSLLWVSIEHALYGLFIFTIGLGHLFYKAA